MLIEENDPGTVTRCIPRACGGDEDAFRSIYDAYEQPVFCLVYEEVHARCAAVPASMPRTRRRVRF